MIDKPYMRMYNRISGTLWECYDKDVVDTIVSLSTTSSTPSIPVPIDTSMIDTSMIDTSMIDTSIVDYDSLSIADDIVDYDN